MDEKEVFKALDKITRDIAVAELREMTENPPIFFKLNKDRAQGKTPSFNVGRSTK